MVQYILHIAPFNNDMIMSKRNEHWTVVLSIYFICLRVRGQLFFIVFSQCTVILYILVSDRLNNFTLFHIIIAIGLLNKY